MANNSDDDNIELLRFSVALALTPQHTFNVIKTQVHFFLHENTYLMALVNWCGLSQIDNESFSVY